MSKDDSLALGLGATRYETDMCSACNKSGVVPDEAVILQRRRQNTAARKNCGQPDIALQKDSLTNQVRMLASLSLTNRMWPNDRYSKVSVKPVHGLYLGFSEN